MQPAIREQPLSLGHLAALPIESRVALVQRTGGADIDAAMSRLRTTLPDVHAAVTSDRLAWAVAFNVTGASADSDPPPPHRGKRSYLDCWHANTSWGDVWSSLVAPRETEDRGAGGTWTSLLELATSVACEHREDWQPPSARPLNRERAQAAFTSLYDRLRHKVAGYVI